MAGLLWGMYHNPLGEKELHYVAGKAGEGILYSAEYFLGQEKVDQAKENAVKGIRIYH